MHLFDELSALLDSIAVSLRSLIWVGILLTFITYALGVFITHVVTEYRVSTVLDEEVEAQLITLYGTLDRSMLVLYEVIASGVSWGMVMDPLTNNISPVLAFLFVVYTSFVFFALMNVVTSFFVDSTIRSVGESRNTKMAMELWSIFKDPNGEPLHGITQDVFNSYLDRKEMQQYLETLDLTAEESENVGLFEILDADGSGEVDADELVRGCLRLRGSAKQVDLATFMRVHTEDMDRVTSMLLAIQGTLVERC